MKIAIIGGGITGLTTAHALRQRGMDCTVYERAPELNEVGAGIWLQPNAMKVMDSLGLGDQLREAGVQLQQAEITGKDLKSLRKSSENMLKDGSGRRITSIHRARLQEILYRNLPKEMVMLGAEYQRHSSDKDPENGKILIEFKDHKADADIILAADGIHSAVRKNVFSQAQTRDSGQVCWRGIANYALPKNFGRKAWEAWGEGVRLGFAPISDQQTYWFAVSSAKSETNASTTGPQARLLKRYGDFHPVINEMIASTPAKRMICAPLTDLRRLKRWHEGRVCLLGDAAHATTPNMGQGAGQGIEDAWYIARALENQDRPEAAFRAFVDQRREKVDMIVNNSWRLGKMAGSSFRQWFMLLMVKWMPESMMEKQMKKIFEVEGL